MNSNSAETVFVGESEMARLMRSHDWSQTLLGSVSEWSQSLKTTVRIVLTSRQPMFVWWGDQLLNLYNDAYAAFLHTKHPALAQPASQLWYEVWDQLEPRIESARCTNEGTFDEALLFIMERKGYPEETYITFSYSPIPNDEGTIGGILCACNDDTHRIVGERQLALLRELAAKAVDARTFDEACTLSASCLETNPYDLPFALIYLVDSDRQCAVLAGTSGIERGHAIAPEAVAFEDDSVWPFAEVVKSQQIGLVADLAARFENLPRGAWDRSPHQAVVVPIAPSGRMGKAGILVVGLNPFRCFDNSYRGFIDLVSAQIAASIANAQVYEEEHKRAKNLAAEATQQNVETILSSISDGFVVLDQDCRFIYVNDRYCELVDTEREALLGQLVWELFPEAADGEAHRQFERALSEQTPVKFEWLFLAWNRWFEYRVYPSPDGLTIFLTEISDRKQAEAALHQREAQFRQLADAMPQIVWIADAEGNPEYVSQRWVDYTGLTLEQTVEQNWINQVIHPDDLEPTYEIWRACLETGTLYQTEFRLRQAFAEQSKDVYRWFLCRAVPIHNPQGEITHWYGTLTDLHDRKQIETALRGNEERLKLAVEAGRMVVWEWNPSADTIITSSNFPEIYGLPELRSAEQGFALTHPDDRTRHQMTVENTAATGDNYQSEFRFIRPDNGAIIWFEERGQAILNSDGSLQKLIGITIDITERKQAEEDLRLNRDRLAFVLTNTGMGLWLNSVPLNDLNWDNRTRELFFIPPDVEPTVELFWSRLHPDDREPTRLAIEASLRDRTLYQIDHRAVNPNTGEIRWIRSAGKAIYAPDGPPIRFDGINYDITDRKQAESEREQLLAREQAARQTAEAASRIKDEFLAVVSHELRSPLNPILGWSKLLRSRQLDAEKTDRALEVIERNAEMQAQLINDLLDVSRILRGKLSLDTNPVDLMTTIQAAMETVLLAAEAKSIQINTNFEQDVGQISGDAGRLQQVIWNLLSNAVKFTSEGGRVEVRLQRVDGGERRERVITSFSSSSYAQITVTDTGKGIPPDFLPYVFEQFSQESSATTRRFGGLGLGLAIVRYLVELHGGTIQADSPGEGQGSTFTVKLPLLSHQPITQPDPKPSKFSLDLQGTRILVVDDDDNTREFLAFLLELHGANVMATATASEALTTLTQFNPEALLSDIGMPDVDGYTLMRQVRALPAKQGGTIPAIALTAYAGEIDYQQAMAAGFQQHIAKPIDPEVLIQAIASLLEQSAAT